MPQNRGNQAVADRRDRAAAFGEGCRNAFRGFAHGGGFRVGGGGAAGKGIPDEDSDGGGIGRCGWTQMKFLGGVHRGMVAVDACADYLGTMTDLSSPAFLDSDRPAVPDLVVPRGIQPFRLPDRPVRGRLIRLGPLAEALLSRHDNHPVVTALTGQALALVAALASALKYRGSFSLQAKGDGPIRMLLADCTDSGALRGYAQADADRLAALLAVTPEPSARDLLGDGYLAFTVDQGTHTERQQGIVTITGTDLANMALHYFATSDQMACSIRLASARTPTGWRASALILERIAGLGGIESSLSAAEQEEAWRTANILAETVTAAELLDDGLAPDVLLYRLFHTEGVAADLPRALAYGCRCSRQRLSGVLETFSIDDLDHMNVEGAIVMTCEFCNYDFRFQRRDVRGQRTDH